MTINEINESASLLIGKPIDGEFAKNIIFECVNIITSLFEHSCPVRSVEIECEDEAVTYPVPKNRGIYKVLEDGKVFKEFEFSVLGIKFYSAGIYQVYYFDSDICCGDVNSELSINAEFHPEIIKYLAYKALQMKDPSSRILENLLNEFFTNIKVINLAISGKAYKNTFIPARIWR